MMRFFAFIFVLTVSAATLAAQSPATIPPQTPAGSPPAGSPPAAGATTDTSPSAALKPTLDGIQQTLGTLKPEKWKVSGVVQHETQTYFTAIRTDLQTTLPPLLATADQTPNSVVQVLPVFRNISALYDVLLRITQIAHIAAPNPQSTALQVVLTNLETRRNELGDRMQATAVTQSQHLQDVQNQLMVIKSTPPPPPVVCPPPPPPPTLKKTKPKAKPKPAPAATPAPTP